METVELIKDPCTVVVPSNIQAMITGVRMAKVFPSGIVQLHYSDNSSESAALTLDQLTEGREEFFKLVSAVQAARGPSHNR